MPLFRSNLSSNLSSKFYAADKFLDSQRNPHIIKIGIWLCPRQAFSSFNLRFIWIGSSLIFKKRTKTLFYFFLPHKATLSSAINP